MIPVLRDLGRLDGPVLVFGGPYGNLEATRALLAAARAHGIPSGRTICTGDIVAYCGDPQATVALLREAGVPVVMGNVEEALAGDTGDCGCGFSRGSSCERMAAQWYAFSRADIDAHARRWMAALPRALRFSLAGRRILAVHGAPSRINRYVFASTSDDDLAAEIAVADCDGVVAGHSGIPFSRTVGGRLWCNAGVIGLPANDGTPRVWYGILRPDRGGLAIEHHALVYDHERAASRMRTRGLPPEYADALASGLWPGLDVLPAAERAAAGKALAPTGLYWPARDGEGALTATPASMPGSGPLPR